MKAVPPNEDPPVDLDAENRRRLIDAVYDAGRTVTIGDVVNRTGLPSQAVAVALRQFAFDSKAHILVDKSGNVAYRFKFGFHRRYALSLKPVFLYFLSLISTLYWLLVKTLFGIVMVLSAWSYGLPFVTFLLGRAAYVYLSATDEERTLGNALSRTVLTEIKHADKTIHSNLFMDCYSFVFGDGNPNYDLEERRWQAIADLIQRHQGVIICEQLSPFTGRTPTEDDMIPVMVRFDGTPEVTSAGQLVYVFPSMAVSADPRLASTRSPNTQSPDQQSSTNFLEEREWKLTGICSSSRLLIGLMVTMHALFFGFIVYCIFDMKTAYALIIAPVIALASLHLGFIWNSIVAAFHVLGFWGLILLIVAITVLTPCLLILSAMFVFYPMLRYLVNQIKNIGVRNRNDHRKQLAEQLGSPSPDMMLKLQAAATLRPSVTHIDGKQAEFDSSKDSLEQRFPS